MVCQAANQTRFRALKHENGNAGRVIVKFMACFQPLDDCQNGLDTKVEKSRKQIKERKNRAKKICGVKKTKASDAAKAGKKK